MPKKSEKIMVTRFFSYNFTKRQKYQFLSFICLGDHNIYCAILFVQTNKVINLHFLEKKGVQNI